MVDEDLNLRIDHAEKTADRPWQFCFILGGGWRRSRQAAEAARNASADFVLAAVAMRQLASRDAIARLEDIIQICGMAKTAREAVERQLEWLEHQEIEPWFRRLSNPSPTVRVRRPQSNTRGPRQ